MKKQKKLRGLQRRKAISGYLFIMPFILGFSMFMVKPFFQSLYMSFCNVEVDSGGFKNIFAGLSNYIRAFTVDPEFNQMLVEEIGSMCINAHGRNYRSDGRRKIGRASCRERVSSPV